LRIATEAWTAFEDYPEFMETIETVTIVEDERPTSASLVVYPSASTCAQRVE
jgi:uncharacterized membrane protein